MDKAICFTLSGPVVDFLSLRPSERDDSDGDCSVRLRCDDFEIAQAIGYHVGRGLHPFLFPHFTDDVQLYVMDSGCYRIPYVDDGEVLNVRLRCVGR